MVPAGRDVDVDLALHDVALPVVVLAPAERGAVELEPAVVESAGGELLERDLGRVADGPEGVVAPAARYAGVGIVLETARVGVPGRDLLEPGIGRWRRLAPVVLAPAFDDAVGAKAARVETAGCELDPLIAAFVSGVLDLDFPLPFLGGRDEDAAPGEREQERECAGRTHRHISSVGAV